MPGIRAVIESEAGRTTSLALAGLQGQRQGQGLVERADAESGAGPAGADAPTNLEPYPPKLEESLPPLSGRKRASLNWRLRRRASVRQRPGDHAPLPGHLCVPSLPPDR